MSASTPRGPRDDISGPQREKADGSTISLHKTETHDTKRPLGEGLGVPQPTCLEALLRVRKEKIFLFESAVTH